MPTLALRRAVVRVSRRFPAQHDSDMREAHYRTVLLVLSSAPTMEAARAIVTMELGISARASDGGPGKPLIMVAAE